MIKSKTAIGRNKKQGITSRLKALANDSKGDNKDSSQYVCDKLINDQDSVWFGSELVYIIRNKLNKSNRSIGSSASILSTDSSSYNGHNATGILNSNNVQSEKFFVLLRKKDDSYYILYVNIKRLDIEIKNSWELRTIRGVDIDDGHGLVLSYDAADYTWSFFTAVDRDETMWILIQCCKHYCATEITIGYSVDLDAIGYAIGSSGTLSKYPLLLKLSSNFRLGTDGITEEEIEAESLLEELNWTSKIEVHGELQKNLSQQSDNLHVEIIDFLLQWECEPMGASINAMKSSAATTAKAGKTSSVAKDTFKRIQDTSEVLNELNSVDEELQGVDDWIEEQLERLGMIQNKLIAVQSESGSLEASWSNLLSVKNIIEVLLRNLDMSIEDENIVSKPYKVVDDALRLVNDTTDLAQHLKPLYTALQQLTSGLTLKSGIGSQFPSLTSAHWKQLQSISSISSQRQKLTSIAKVYCNQINDNAAVMLESILKHKAINNINGKNIAVRQFLFSKVIEESIRIHDTTRIGSSTDDSVTHISFKPTARYDSNQAISAQRCYHDALVGVLPLLESAMLFDSTRILPLSSIYVNYTQAKVYKPLIKGLFKDLDDAVGVHHALVSYATLPIYNKQSPASSVLLKFNHKGGKATTSLSPWMAFACSLVMLPPIIKSEDIFFNSLFNLTSMIDTISSKQSKSEAMLAILFDTLPKRMSKLVTASSADSDGFEALAMLTVLTQYNYYYSDDINATSYFNAILSDISDTLIKAIDSFLADQVAYIQHYRGDPKKAGVLPIVAKFPSFVLQLFEVTNTSRCREVVDRMIEKVVKEVLKAIEITATSNEKYTDVVRMHNYMYLDKSMKALDVECLQKYLALAGKGYTESESKYIQWMISYEFPSLIELSTRMDGIVNRVRDEELSLYIKRRDVLAAVKDLDPKKMEALIVSMRSRLLKHCYIPDDTMNNEIVSVVWAKITSRMVSILTRIADVASVSYQMTINIGPAIGNDLCSKYSNDFKV